MENALYVALGSVAGGLSRYFLGGFVQRTFHSQFPYGTLAVNLTGCFLVGLIGAIAGERIPLTASARIILITGFCGAFTTFSAFMVESDFLLRSGNWPVGLLNVSASLIGGFALFRLGYFVGKC